VSFHIILFWSNTPIFIVGSVAIDIRVKDIFLQLTSVYV